MTDASTDATTAPDGRLQDAAVRSEASLAARPVAPGDHAEIDRLAGQLVPALVARLSATGLGEIEVREGGWKVRLRRPGGPSLTGGRRSTDRPSRPQPGHEGHGHPPGALEGHRSARPPASAHSSNGSAPAVEAGAGAGRGSGKGADPHRAVATSPAVGVFQVRREARHGARVQAGDRLGAVDMLGVPQEVVAPADGSVAAILVESGDPVEYGQELVAIELMTGSGGALGIDG